MKPLSNASETAIDSYRSRIISALQGFDFGEIKQLVSLLQEARDAGSTIYVAGNGGSASTVGHYVIDWMLGTEITEPSIRVVSLADSTASITATANDKSFQDVFSRQVRHLGRPGDVVLVVSASGNSPNLVALGHRARSMNMKFVAITGFDGGALKKIADISVHVPTEVGDYGVAEDLHLMVGHVVKEALIAAVTDEA